MQTTAIRSELIERPTKQRSAVTNGRLMFVEGDGRSPWARRWRDLVELHVADLGGTDLLSEAQLSMCRRIATLEVEIEKLEGALSKGEEVDLDLYNRAAGNLRRLLETIGLKRVARNVPTLAEYLASQQREGAR